jgi:predicted nucleic acid-binding Zn finger protein
MQRQRRVDAEAAARQLVSEGKVKLYVFRPSGRSVWIVVGRHRDYLVMPSVPYCTCDDFFFRVINNEKPLCYHLLAVRIASESGAYEVIEEGDDWYWQLIWEWIDWSRR